MSKLSVRNYQIYEKIGEGAMSEVYKGTDNSGKVYAFKILRPYLKSEEKYFERFRAEAKILSSLSDDRIVKFYKISETSDGRIALVCEFVEGKNLEEIKFDDKAAMPAMAASIVAEILLGLEESHRRGVIHRDLKPENILLTKEGRLKITDFGVSKNFESEQLTLTGFVLGSPAYMSPEQAQGNSVDQRSDLFALGILLYYLSSKELPFRGTTYQEMISSIMNKETPAIEKLNPFIHPMLAKVIYKSLAKDPVQRYQKSYEFRYDLMQFLDYVQAPSSLKMLSCYFEGQTPLELGRYNWIQTLITRSSESLNKDQKTQSLIFARQAYEIDPQNEEVKNLLNKVSDKERKYPFKTAAAICIFLVAGYFTFLNMPSDSHINHDEEKLAEIIEQDVKTVQSAIEKNPTVNELDIPPKEEKTIIEKKVEQKKKVVVAPKIEKKPIKKVRRQYTKIQFNIDEGVEVYIDGRKARLDDQGRVNVLPGEHELMLIKPDSNPVRGKIIAVKNQTTVINAK